MGRPVVMQLRRSAALAAALLCLGIGTANGSTNDARLTPRTLLSQAEAVKTTNHPRFLHILKELHEDQSLLSPTQQWHLRYLDAWQAAFMGNLTKATPVLHDIIDHSDNEAQVTRASALMINVLSRGDHYEAAYTLANKLMSSMPKVTDTVARSEALREIVQMLGWAGQYDQALQYAKKLRAEHTPGKDRCPDFSYEVNMLYDANKLSSTNPELRKAIELCLSAKQIIYANTLRLDQASLLTEEGHSDQAIALLHQIAPSIRRTKFQPHIASLLATLAQAYLSQNNDAAAKKAALNTLMTSKHSGYTGVLQAAYGVLYKVEKKAGNGTAALSYYEKYVALHDASMNETKERALAYQMVKQEVLAKKLKLEKLTKKNRILQLRQELAEKAAETSHLYIALLIAAIILIGLWLYRLKHSQLRFRRMARHDDLTETFNRQHFLDEAKRVLQRLSKDKDKACLIIIDLDHFKRINDLYGHIAGDEVLKHAVEISRKELRASDVFGRLGGEEFGILMPACSSAQGAEIGERIRLALASTSTKLNSGDSITVSASIGLACSDLSGYELVQLLIDADAALYTAKRSGRNRLIIGTGKDTRPRTQGLAKASKPVRE